MTDGKIIARREIEDFEGRGDTRLAATLFTTGYRLHFPGFPPLDRAGHENVVGRFREAFPDLSIAVEEQIAAGDRVANRWSARGTHRGPFQGVPPTGKPVVITGHNVMRFEGDRIAELWGELDAVGLLAQLGVVPAGPPAPAPDVRPTDANGGLAVVRRFIENFNEGCVGAIADDFAEDYALDFPGGPTGAGKAGLRDAVAGFRAAFPDLRFETEDLFEEHGRVVWRWTMRGTHRGPLGPFPASERPVALTGISVLRVRGGLVARDAVRADMAGLLAQIGALPAG